MFELDTFANGLFMLWFLLIQAVLNLRRARMSKPKWWSKGYECLYVICWVVLVMMAIRLVAFDYCIIREIFGRNADGIQTFERPQWLGLPRARWTALRD